MCTAALDYVKGHPQDPLDQQAFETACGVGVVVTPEQIEDAVRRANGNGFSGFSAEIIHFNTHSILN